MSSYQPRVREFQFILNEVLNLTDNQAGVEYDRELADSILEAAATFAAEVVAPLNAIGDAQGCSMPSLGTVKTPDGFSDAYNQYTSNGWTSLSCDPAYGGQGMPGILNAVVAEMMAGANFGWMMYPGMSNAAYTCLAANGNEAQKALYLPSLCSGRWAGTMCLTEPHAGTDLGQLRTRAKKEADGSYRITGSKIFISGGEQDLTENIIHLVLARVEGSPAGSKGISLFVVPKFLVNADGSLGERNGVICGSVEHKMGIHGNATCTMNFDNATGWLVGEENKGLSGMFVMMNHARIGVGLSAIGIMEAAYQKARSYALERVQGRPLVGTNDRATTDTIVAHPDVRRLLLTQKAYLEGARALALWACQLNDVLHASQDAGEKKRADDLLALVTPIVKALSSDLAVEGCNHAIQVFGGHGFIVENGVEQHLRDARIIPLYEGTNGVQAMDLLGRKVLADTGMKLRLLITEIGSFVEAQQGQAGMQEFLLPLKASLETLQNAAVTVGMQFGADQNAVGSAASPFLRLAGHVCLAWMWARMAEVSLINSNSADPLYAAKLATARFFFQQLLPTINALEKAIAAGPKSLMSINADAL
ncbi:acyl-CoA dehydrogenase C-terminal domain-containing protein [Pseudomonas aeruginosa]|uniref:acyl-CoA dehydrogenase C-terminal domain-containing protein n=1 Tax=Pseudomonas aeruginosa TaxID=287 RepID=UPI003D2B425C